MLSIYQLKSVFQDLLRPLVKFLASRKITANQITVIATLLSFLFGAVILIGHDNKKVLFLIPFVLFVRMALNAIDGLLAKEHNMKSDLGVFLNELGDVLSDAGLYLPFAMLPGIFGHLVVGAVILGIISEMAGVLALAVNRSRRYDGPMGKSDRAFVFGLISVLYGIWGTHAQIIINGILVIALCLLVLTVYNRVRKALGVESL